jgi:hypothetical protein
LGTSAKSFINDFRYRRFLTEQISKVSSKKEKREKKEEKEDIPEISQNIRSDFRETAFFYPDLKTDENGNILLSFKLPDSLTTWKVLGFAHTKDLEFGFTTCFLLFDTPSLLFFEFF